jgi:hypothetical protein
MRDKRKRRLNKQEELRRALEEQIAEKEQYKQHEKVKQQEYERKLEMAIGNINRRQWENEKSDSQRDREKEQYKDELQEQMRQRKIQDSMSIQQRRAYEVEVEKKVKREVFEMNNQYRIENGEEPLSMPKELMPREDVWQEFKQHQDKMDVDSQQVLIH